MFKVLFQALLLTVSLASLTPVMAAPTSGSAAKAKTETTVKAPEETGKNSEEATDKISINTATADELAAALNGVGQKKAEAIISYREKYGPFSQVEQLKEVPGFGPSLVDRNLSRMKL